MGTFKLIIDEDNNIAYMYLDESKRNDVANTIELNENMNIDIDKNGTVIGIEFLDAKEQFKNKLRPSMLKFAFQNMRTMNKPVECQMTVNQ